MSFKMCYGKVRMLCPVLHRRVDVHIQYVTKDGKIYIVDSNGCNEGFNDSKDCSECLKRSIEIFKEGNL